MAEIKPPEEKIITQLEFYSGIHEIGGNKIAIVAGNGKGVLLDFGWAFSISRDYLDNFLQFRKYQYLLDSFTIGELPLPKGTLRGIYREDMFLPVVKQLQDNFHVFPANPSIITDVLISHAHSDHIGEVKCLHPDIHVVCSDITYELVKLMGDIEASSSIFSNLLEYTSFKETALPENRKKKNLPKTVRQFSPLKSEKSIICAENGFEVTFIETDHSLPGAGAFLIRDLITGIRIVYSGDIRKHGPLHANTEKFMNIAADFQPDILICEGTRIGRDKTHESSEFASEKEVEKEISRIIKEIETNSSLSGDSGYNENMVFFDCSIRDVWRLQTLYRAAQENNRILVLMPKSFAYLKKSVDLGIITDVDLSKVRIYIRKQGFGDYCAKDYVQPQVYGKILSKPPEEMVEKPKWKNIDMEKKEIIKPEEINAHPADFLIQMPFYKISNLIDIKPPANSYYILSKSEPFDIEGEIEKKKLQNWLDRFGIYDDGIHIRQAHCSGHASPKDLKEIIETIHPKFLFPVHTENPEKFSELGLSADIKIISPKKSKKYHFHH